MSYQEIRNANLITLNSGFGILDEGRHRGPSLLERIDSMMINGRISRSAADNRPWRRIFGLG